MLPELDTICDDVVGSWDTCVDSIWEDAEVDEANIDDVDPELDVPEIDESDDDDIDPELEDVSDVKEEVTEDRLLSTELSISDAEVGIEELLPMEELDSTNIVDKKVSWAAILLESGVSLVVESSLDIDVSLDACV